MERPNWDSYFMLIAMTVATRSTCLSRRVGAVIADHDNAILSTGYNGPPSGLTHCGEILPCRRADVGPGERLDLCRAVHAEANAIGNAARHGSAVRGATLYVTVGPCANCAGLIINAGIKRVVTIEDYAVEGQPSTQDVFRYSKVRLEYLRGAHNLTEAYFMGMTVMEILRGLPISYNSPGGLLLLADLGNETQRLAAGAILRAMASVLKKTRRRWEDGQDAGTKE